ncbi:MAG: 16S rRNA (guanine(527)-N(7))-methyltransferase RsmG [Crocinitomicaceae bacterium]
MKLITAYFPKLNSVQVSQFEQLKELYEHWNSQINVISRKDTDHFYERHVLHSLGIARLIQFNDKASILDVGTGGGFPGIPLAILFPETHFTLVDSIGKKIKVVNEVSKTLALSNVIGIHSRAEQVDGKFDFIVSRAVTQMPEFIPWVHGKIRKENHHALKNGILYLKGGDLTEEMKPVKQEFKIYPLAEFFQESFFETKQVVHVSMTK